MDLKTIDRIVWWIPIKRLRNYVRESLKSINKNKDLLLDLHIMSNSYSLDFN